MARINIKEFCRQWLAGELDTGGWKSESGIKGMMWGADNDPSSIAREKFAAHLIKLAKVDQIPDMVDNVVNLTPQALSEKVIPIDAGKPVSNAATN